VPRRDDRVGRHGWNSFQGYFNAHDSRIADLCNDGFILENGLTREWLGREFDHTTWREILPPKWVGEEAWPHLNEVVEELRDWWENEGKHQVA
jgi:hypothetical protein